MRFDISCCFVAYTLVILSLLDVPWIWISYILTALSTASFRKLNGTGISSPTCFSIPVKSMVLRSNRAGVPVCRRPSLNPALFRDADSPMDGSSPSLPAGNLFMPFQSSKIIEEMAWRVNHLDVSLPTKMCLYISQPESSGWCHCFLVWGIRRDRGKLKKTHQVLHL